MSARITPEPAQEQIESQEQDTVKSITWQGTETTKERDARNDSLAEGRYRLEDAAILIEKERGERAAGILKKLMQAAHDGTLAVHEPGKQARYRPETVREWHAYSTPFRSSIPQHSDH